jgi:hypothetical protein
MMKHVALIAMLLLAAGCLGDSSAVSTAGRGSSPNGVVSGTVVTEGGPSMRDSSGGSDIRPMGNAQIRVTGTTAAGSKITRHLIADSGGRFQVALPPGDYTISAFMFPVAPRQPHRHVVVRRGQSVTIQIKGYLVYCDSFRSTVAG